MKHRDDEHQPDEKSPRPDATTGSPPLNGDDAAPSSAAARRRRRLAGETRDRPIVIDCKDITKRYKIFGRSHHRLMEALSFYKLRLHEDLWALRGVSLRVPQGSALGLVGSNGAGKSTLLKILTGTTYPSSGSFFINGKVSALLELGAGFHPDFTGRDNIYMNASILGFSKEEVDERYNAICEFSELDDFIYRPVRIYSSGMVMRLGFSVAIAMNPEVLIIDEILAVGDQHFQKKCIDRIHEYQDSGKTILFCSHTLYHVRQICDQAIWLKEGRIQMAGNPIEVTNEYSAFERARNKEAMRASDQPAGSAKGPKSNAYPEINQVVFSKAGSTEPARVVKTGDDVDVHVWYDIPDKSIDFNIGVAINRADNIYCFGASCDHDSVAIAKTGYAIFKIKNLRLLAGEFFVRVYLADDKSIVLYDQSIDEVSFKVEYHGYELGLFRADIAWEFVEDDRSKSLPGTS